MERSTLTNDKYLTIDEFAEIVYKAVVKNQTEAELKRRWHPEDLEVMFSFAVEYTGNALSELIGIRKRENVEG